MEVVPTARCPGCLPDDIIHISNVSLRVKYTNLLFYPLGICWYSYWRYNISNQTPQDWACRSHHSNVFFCFVDLFLSCMVCILPSLAGILMNSNVSLHICIGFMSDNACMSWLCLVCLPRRHATRMDYNYLMPHTPIEKITTVQFHTTTSQATSCRMSAMKQRAPCKVSFLMETCFSNKSRYPIRRAYCVHVYRICDKRVARIEDWLSRWWKCYSVGGHLSL